MKKKIIAIIMTAVMAVSMMAIGVSAASETVEVAAVTEALGAFNVSNLMSVIKGGLGIAIPLVLAWFAFRWIYKKAKGALKKGG